VKVDGGARHGAERKVRELELKKAADGGARTAGLTQYIEFHGGMWGSHFRILEAQLAHLTAWRVTTLTLEAGNGQAQCTWRRDFAPFTSSFCLTKGQPTSRVRRLG
jgi:hypothetical protein